MIHPKPAILGASAVALCLVALQQFPSASNAQPIARQSVEAHNKAKPFQDNNGDVPSKAEYPGKLFKLSHKWPKHPPRPLANPPWRAAIGNRTINVKNASAYANALKEAVRHNASRLIMDQPNWDAHSARWYNEPWVGSEREAISGTYGAGSFTTKQFPTTNAPFTTQVLTYYDERAATALHKVWGETAMRPNVTTMSGQFPEGSIVVKAALFTSADPNMKTGWWDAMEGAQMWNLWLSPDGIAPPEVWPGYVAQFDIIVKDSLSAPQTGWVFTTLVYDKDAPGTTVWDKMVPLGAQWGNDPQATRQGMPLKENWINPKAPKYSKMTLGWGGRLSGPNDGATNDITVGSKAYANYPNSSCMSCHSTAQWNVKNGVMPTFLLPNTAKSGTGNPASCNKNGQPDNNQKTGTYICSPAPGSAAWMKWFQNRKGTQPMDAGSVAMDFDEVFSFKSLGNWKTAVTPGNQTPSPMRVRIPGKRRHNLYNGAPLQHQ